MSHLHHWTENYVTSGQDDNFFGYKCKCGATLLPDNAIELLNGKQWTQTPPTEPGFYWVVFIDRLTIAEVYEREINPVRLSVVTMLSSENYETDSKYFKGWLGPIPAPPTPEAAK